MMTSKVKALHYNMGLGIIALSTKRDALQPNEPYSGFNACYYTHGNPQEVAVCRNAVIGILPGIKTLIMPRQTHSLNVIHVDSDYSTDPADVDGLVSADPDVALAINTADCVPVLMADAESGVIAAVHSGWRGTVGHIAVKALDMMAHLGAVRSRVKVVMGPSICTDCFEVGPEVAEIFEHEFCNAHEIVNRTFGIKPHINLRKAITADLEKAGVNLCNIDTVTAPCSRCNWTQWWSARKLGIKSGRTTSLIALSSHKESTR